MSSLFSLLSFYLRFLVLLSFLLLFFLFPSFLSFSLCDITKSILSWSFLWRSTLAFPVWDSGMHTPTWHLCTPQQWVQARRQLLCAVALSWLEQNAHLRHIYSHLSPSEISVPLTASISMLQLLHEAPQTGNLNDRILPPSTETSSSLVAIANHSACTTERGGSIPCVSPRSFSKCP